MLFAHSGFPYLEQMHCSLHIFYCLDLENLGNAFPLCVFNFGLAVHRVYVALEQKKKKNYCFVFETGWSHFEALVSLELM